MKDIKIRQYWIDRGADGSVVEGFTCIGIGFSNMEQTFGVTRYEIFSWHRGSYKKLYNNWKGFDTSRFYYLKTEKFDSLFPPINNNFWDKIVKINILNVDHFVAVQSRLFELGVCWAGAGKFLSKVAPNAIFIINGLIHRNSSYSENITLTLEDLYKCSFKETVIEVKLNDDYTAIVRKDSIEVGCQTFTMDAFERLSDAVNKARNNID